MGIVFLMVNQRLSKCLMYRCIEKISALRRCTTISCGEGEHKETLKLTKNATFINNGINMTNLQQLINSMKDNIVEHPFTVCTMGRICYQKNPSLFNKVAENLPDIRFVWIGDGELKDELKASNIEITGWIDRKKALEYSLSSDVFMLTSLYEGLPFSLLEAMYLKKICVVSDVIGNHDVIHNGINGFVCEKLDDFVVAIKKAQKGSYNEYLEKSYEEIKFKYNTGIMADKYLFLFYKTLERNI